MTNRNKNDMTKYIYIGLGIGLVLGMLPGYAIGYKVAELDALHAINQVADEHTFWMPGSWQQGNSAAFFSVLNALGGYHYNSYGEQQ